VQTKSPIFDIETFLFHDTY